MEHLTQLAARIPPNGRMDSLSDILFERLPRRFPSLVRYLVTPRCVLLIALQFIAPILHFRHHEPLFRDQKIHDLARRHALVSACLRLTKSRMVTQTFVGFGIFVALLLVLPFHPAGVGDCGHDAASFFSALSYAWIILLYAMVPTHSKQTTDTFVYTWWCNLA